MSKVEEPKCLRLSCGDPKCCGVRLEWLADFIIKATPRSQGWHVHNCLRKNYPGTLYSGPTDEFLLLVQLFKFSLKAIIDQEDISHHGVQTGVGVKI